LICEKARNLQLEPGQELLIRKWKVTCFPRPFAERKNQYRSGEFSTKQFLVAMWISSDLQNQLLYDQEERMTCGKIC